MNTLIEPAAPTFLNATTDRSGLERILYVEDDPALHHLFTLVLIRAGYAVTSAEDGLQAWEALLSDRFDLLITDNEMPRLTGLELVAKARLEGMKLPIIMASGSANHLDGPDYEWLHFSARLQKPFASDELLETVRQVLRAASSTWRSGDVFSPVIPYQHWGLNE